MKLLPYYSSRNLSNNEETFQFLLDTLKDSIFTWDYFVDFTKAINNVKKIETELTLLNKLIGLNDDEIDEAFTTIITNYPSVRKVLSILIAARLDKIADTPIIDDLKTMIAVNKRHIFDPRVELTAEILGDLLTFFEQSGLKAFLVNQEVHNLIDYCKGIEVGMDTNARKNRTGTSMEILLENNIRDFCELHGLKYMSQATQKKIEDVWGIHIDVDKIARRFDFAIVDAEGRLSCIEVNYYSGGGSKLKATAGEYKQVQRFLTDQDITFIWVTDGKGWLTAKTALQETFILNDYTVNLQMITDGILEEILLQNNLAKL